ncbi:MAG: hypothetical protein AB8G95_07530 [Anaerolineae bacterium]
MKRKLILIALLMLLIPIGLAVAQSSTNFRSNRFSQMSGGSSESTNYRVRSITGQPLAETSQSANFSVTSGFLAPNGPSDTLVWLPLVGR